MKELFILLISFFATLMIVTPISVYFDKARKEMGEKRLLDDMDGEDDDRK